MSFKAADNIPPKLDLMADLAQDPILAEKIYRDSVPDPSTTPQAKDATSPSGTLPEVTNPFDPAFNDLEIVSPSDKPKTPGAAPDAGSDVLTDPFNPRFNVPGNLKKPGDAAAKPDVIVNPFDPNYVEVPKGGKDVPAPAVKGPDSNLPPQLDVDPFDPFKDWNSVPGLVPTEPKVAPQDATVKPGPELPKPADPVVKPVEPVSPGGEVPKPSDKIVPPTSDKVVPNPVFNESNVGEAVKLATAKNQPIIVISTPDGKMDAAQQAAMQANASDAVFVNVNFQQADQMMRAGLETTHYWQLANLCGAAGDVNNLYQKPGFIGRFNATDFKPEDPKGSLKPVAANDAEKVFGAMVKPPAPGPFAPVPVKPDGKIEPPPPLVPGTDGKVEPAKEVPVQPEKGPVKLDKADFTEAEADKAIQYAKDNNLPLIVYKGAKTCGNCPTTRGNMEAFGREMQGKSTTDAVVLRLDWDNLGKVEGTNAAAAEAMRTLVPPGTGFPNVAVYNPNNLSKPLGDVYGSQMSEIKDLLKIGQDSMKATTRSDAKPVTPIPPPFKPSDKPAEIQLDPNTIFNPEPSAMIEPTVKPRSDAPVVPVKDVPVQPEKKGPVKLDKADFTSEDADKAVQFAKDNNLPLIVYRGSKDCPNCPTTRGNMQQFGKEIEGKAATDAVVLRLDWAQLGEIEATNPAAAKAMRDVVPPGTRFPNVAVFNPNDLRRPLGSTYGSDINEIRGLVKTGQDSVGRSTGNDSAKRADTTSGAAAAPSAFNENNVLDATRAANEKNIPLISYVDGQANPKMANALKYLQDSGLASTVSISEPKAERMLRNGLESKHYYALKNAMTSAAGTTSGAHLSSFAPANLKPGQQFAPGRSTDAKASADQIVSFLKESGVDLSKNNSEAAVRALLDGAPIPPAPKAEEKNPEAPPEVKPEAPSQPEAKKPDAPVLPEVKVPDAPTEPEAKKPDAPAQPAEAKKPDAPVLPEVKVPDAPAQPAEAKKPDAPVLPEPPTLPELNKPATPLVPEVKKDVRAAESELKKPDFLEKLRIPSEFPLFDEILPVKAEKNVDAKNEFKAKTADEALNIIADAKKRNLPLVVHSMTVICTDQTCTPTYLPKGLPSQFADQAVFLELPHSGVKIPDGAQYDELRAINALYKTTPEDHKTELDLHVFKLNAKSAYELNDGNGGAKRNAGSFIKARLEAASKDSKKP